MLVLDQANTYTFSNMVVKITDNTVPSNESASNVKYPVPEFNVLIPTVQDVGSTNVMELYLPGQVNRYVAAHGKPNCLKYGFGPDIIHAILSRANSGVGVYTVNLRGVTATMANLIVILKYRVAKDVPYVDEQGNPYYLNQRGEVTTTPTDGKPIVRDVLHIRFDTAHLEDCKKWSDLHKAMNNLYSETEDAEGYKSAPWFSIMCRGASSFGNTIYFSMVPRVADYDGNTYYMLNLFDGTTMITTDSIYSMDVNSGEKYNTTYYIENLFNNAFPTLQYMSSEDADMIYKLFAKYLYTLEDYINGTMDKPSVTFPEIDAFNCNTFGIVTDDGSLNSQITNAFALKGGSDGEETRDELFRQFFRGEIITSLASVLQWKYNYIPDIGYDADTKQGIVDLVNKRYRMTTATIMVGGTDSFNSALIEHQAKWYQSNPNIRQILAIQSPMMWNSFIKRTVTYPGSYFDTVALIEHFAKWGNFYQPFAGADARWTGFIDDTMAYPPENAEMANAFANNRINYVMQDSEEGAYLVDQQMNTEHLSDQTEFNNAFLISAMLYDLLNLVHRNSFKFNEAEEVRLFNEAVNNCINNKYAAYSASLSCEVYRMGTIGRAKSANKITVIIDLKDISKYANVELILVDE